MPREISPLKQKLLLVLMAGLAIGFSYSPRRHFRIIKGLTKAWQKIDQQKLKREIQALYRSKLVELKENPDGTFTMILANKGKLKALNYYFAEMKIKKDNWDGKWRLVIFDIPEKIKKARNALREKLKSLGFYELQKSVFIFPYECKDEIDFLIEFFNLRKFVRYGILETIDNDLHLREIFKLI
ncbi:MAG: CRISPR-associated endonuclease Cas2 [Patescibacteria group bacterium]|nr:CRISPR-associated endonuclease Cas2 [Patescibacteria group bacterium]